MTTPKTGEAEASGVLGADRVGVHAGGSADLRPEADPWRRFWAPRRLSWWVALAFVVGSVFFVVGAIGSLIPAVFGGHGRMSVFVEGNYFIGATLYTVGIYAQLLDRLNADQRVDPGQKPHGAEGIRWFCSRGADLTDLRILVSLAFLIGSVAFNYETTFALGSALEVLPKVGLWETSLLGSVFFLLAGVLQFAAVGERYLGIDVRDVSWWVAVLFIVGGVGFVIGSLPGLGAPGLPTAKQGSGPLVVKIGFLVGGVAYLVGSYLMLPELFTQLRRRRKT